jgi:hypothetical protein
MPRPNIVVLRNLLQSLPAAHKLFAMLAGRAELAQWISVDELIENLELGRRNAVDLLRDIANAGAGEFRLGRKGHPSRLVWSTDPRALVDRVLGREPELADDAADPTESEPFDAAYDEIEHVFMLRPQLRIALSLPIDLSGREATAIGDWVRNLSFDR